MVDWSSLAAAGAVSIPVIVALVAVFKSVFTGFNAKYLPVVSIVCGMLVCGWLAILNGADAQGVRLAVTSGVLAGLAASATYHYGADRQADDYARLRRG